MECTTNGNWNYSIQVLSNITTYSMAVLYVHMYRYAFVDSFSVYWANQATGTVNEGEQIVLLLCMYSA